MIDDKQYEVAQAELETIFDFVRWIVSCFNQADVYFGHGTNNAWDEAYSLVFQAIHLPFERSETLDRAKLTSAEKALIIQWVKQRIHEQKPLAYISNHALFCDLPFYVDERVLVPRSPISELIQQKFSTLLNPNSVNRVLDLCTGSGCIAIACAYAFENAEIDAADISLDALEVCEINIEQHGLWQQVIPIQSDVFSGLDNQQYDLIVSNPPYVDQEDMDDLPDEFRHEPELGLAAGFDGLDIVRTILAQASDYLTDNGILVVEVGNSQIHLEAAFPQVPFQWLEFEHGGHGVFAIDKASLIAHQAAFSA
ncbi:50S ribosomal protein L3 N(5)-glutamine methyltransferase [Catenovulum sp. 2E275]|uniref:50S ribosomal protein L3 N(5)-glutamine methyltransferase n=1 Tax=Catenovulum sp. 2E275 TaxID=2980497 RepID=UPI0021D010F1|nr:50S ribosomal protein L3 N(5)-glutamine methyltransferase [Catenovulum sp. 2E275]MCU4674806.1 50S ribosomal protein L3 N(5)-glutamine methyltransferase [Catenovulum sp. 2E275]